MGEFRIGRKHAQHSYPDTPRSAVASYARNSALGPQDRVQSLPAPLGANILWLTPEIGVAGANIPITPRVTGIVRVASVVVCQNAAFAPDAMVVELILDGVPIGLQTGSTIDAATEAGNGLITIPYEIIFAPGGGGNAPLTLAPHTIAIHVTPSLGGVGTSVLALSTVDIQELPLAS
jgi:hypothetical protein